jgi:hypothetical protein
MQISDGVHVSDAFQALIELPPVAIRGRMFCVEISRETLQRGRRPKKRKSHAAPQFAEPKVMGMGGLT